MASQMNIPVKQSYSSISLKNNECMYICTHPYMGVTSLDLQ